VFVHSPRVEGIHLRGGAVARGGLRWSDRRDDVRTEVLDLVKAQVLKNALIVPTGAKGGFVVSRTPRDPQALRDEVERCYVTFIRGLLDVTDDLAEGGDTVVAPPGVVRHDGDDSYLVVAADRGTATFSDTANGVAERYGFWLGDAFASGGSRGYDHKALGVTAKGAWRAVSRHFRELGIDVQSEPIRVVGIGDMSGDVFSNGMQRSETIELVAAFDHRHIFLDPDPDAAASFRERQRLAELPRSSWDDYDRTVLSEGGMIVPRDVRSVELSDPVRERLRVDAEELSPPSSSRPSSPRRSTCCGPAASAPTSGPATSGTRRSATAPTWASASPPRRCGPASSARARTCRSPSGPASSSPSAGRASTRTPSTTPPGSPPPTPRSTSRSCSTSPSATRSSTRTTATASSPTSPTTWSRRSSRRWTSRSRRSPPRWRGAPRTSRRSRPSCRLEQTGELDRTVEVLPTTDELQARADAGGGLTRPELATLFAWSKRELKEALLASDAPDDPVLRDAVRDPFPARAVERFGYLLPRHRLRRELVATGVANRIVDRFGVTFAGALAAETGMGLPLVARAVRVAIATVDAERWWSVIEELEGAHDPSRIIELTDVVNRLVTDLTTALLQDTLLVRDPLALLERDQAVAGELVEHGLELGSINQQRARVAHARWLVDDLVEPDLARFLAVAPDLAIVPDVAVLLTIDPERSPVPVADVALHLAEELGIDRVSDQLGRVPLGEGWARRQHRGVDLDLRRLRRDAAAVALRTVDDRDLPPEEIVRRFIDARLESLARTQATIAQLEDEPATLDAIAVAVRAIRQTVDRQRAASGLNGRPTERLVATSMTPSSSTRSAGSSEPFRSTSSCASRSWHQASSPGPERAREPLEATELARRDAGAAGVGATADLEQLPEPVGQRTEQGERGLPGLERAPERHDRRRRVAVDDRVGHREPAHLAVALDARLDVVGGERRRARLGRADLRHLGGDDAGDGAGVRADRRHRGRVRLALQPPELLADEPVPPAVVPVGRRLDVVRSPFALASLAIFCTLPTPRATSTRTASSEGDSR
jgi:glutamate dehydrogenase